MHYKETNVWQKAMALAVEVYRVTATFPKYEMYGLAQQMREAAVSVPCNIAEGAGRGTLRDERQFVRTARGSLYELETEILIASRQQYFDATTCDSLLERSAEVGRLLNGVLRSIARQLQAPPPPDN